MKDSSIGTDRRDRTMPNRYDHLTDTKHLSECLLHDMPDAHCTCLDWSPEGPFGDAEDGTYTTDQEGTVNDDR